MICKRNSHIECLSNGKQCDFCQVSENKFEFKKFIKAGNKALKKPKKEETIEDAIEFWKNLIESGKVTVIFP